MSKMSDMAMTIEELRNAAAAITDVPTICRDVLRHRSRGTTVKESSGPEASLDAGTGTSSSFREIPCRSHGRRP